MTILKIVLNQCYGGQNITLDTSVGGYRASMYNAMDIDSVKALVEVMSELESKI